MQKLKLLWYKRQWWIINIFEWLFPRQLDNYREDVLTEALHPEFGWVWRDEEQGGKYIKAAEFRGWCECLNSVRATIEMYPNGGGDIDIMKGVEKLIQEAKCQVNTQRMYL